MPSAEHLHLEQAFTAGFVTLAAAALTFLLPPEHRRLFSLAALAAAIVLVGVDFAPLSVLVGVTAALAASLLKPRYLAMAVSVVPLAFVASRFPDGWSESLTRMTVVVALVGGLAAYVSERLVTRRWLSLLLVISAAGVFGCAPDTEQIAVVGAVAGVLALAYLLVGRRLDGTSQLLMAGATLTVLVVWAGGVGSVGRPATLAGVAACLGVLVALPVAWWLLTPLRRRYDPSVPIVVLMAVQVLVVIPASRVVGLESDNETAAAGAALLLIGTICGLAVAGLVAAGVRGPLTSEPELPQL